MSWELEWETTIWKNKHLLTVSFCIYNIQLYLFIINIEPCLKIIVFQSHRRCLCMKKIK